jgi:hypothetical protein
VSVPATADALMAMIQAYMQSGYLVIPRNTVDFVDQHERRCPDNRVDFLVCPCERAVAALCAGCGDRLVVSWLAPPCTHLARIIPQLITEGSP